MNSYPMTPTTSLERSVFSVPASAIVPQPTGAQMSDNSHSDVVGATTTLSAVPYVYVTSSRGGPVFTISVSQGSEACAKATHKDGVPNGVGGTEVTDVVGKPDTVTGDPLPTSGENQTPVVIAEKQGQTPEPRDRAPGEGGDDEADEHEKPPDKDRKTGKKPLMMKIDDVIVAGVLYELFRFNRRQ